MTLKIDLTILALVCALAAAPGVALAQNAAKDSALEAYASASPPSSPADEPADSELTPEESAILHNSLNFDPVLNSAAPAKSLRLPRLSSQGKLDIKRTERPDGTSTVAVKQPLPIDWDAKVGADVGLAANAPDGYNPGVSRANNSAGAAWASVGVVPNFASVDARVDPSNDQGKVGTTIQHSLPLGRDFSLTLKNSYSVMETLSVPGPAASTTQPVGQVWGNEKAAKIDILSTGTTLGAGLASTSIDPLTHHTLSAEQKLYGSLRVTTAVTDLGQPVSNKSVSAGFKLNW